VEFSQLLIFVELASHFVHPQKKTVDSAVSPLASCRPRGERAIKKVPPLQLRERKWVFLVPHHRLLE
jgi:hypothetical protein